MTDGTKSQEERIAALEAELASLRKPVLKEAPLHQTIDGQGSVPFDRAGNRVVPPAVPANTTVGANGGFGSPYRADGTFAPDGIARDPRSGEVLSKISPGSMGTGPVRNVQHQHSIDLLDKAFPVIRPTKE